MDSTSTIFSPVSRKRASRLARPSVGRKSSIEVPVGKNTTSLSRATSVVRSSAKPRVSTTSRSYPSAARRNFLMLLAARASTSGSISAAIRVAAHSTQDNCSRSKSPISTRWPWCAAATANTRASALLPTPPFCPIKEATIMGNSPWFAKLFFHHATGLGPVCATIITKRQPGR